MFFNEDKLLPTSGYLDPVTAIAGGAAISGIMGHEAAGKASRATARASKASIAEQRRQFDVSRADRAPYRAAGREALLSLSDMMGLKTENPYTSEIAELQRQIASVKKPVGKGFAAKAKMAAATKGIPAQQQKLQDLIAKSEAFESREKYDFQESPGYQFRLGEGMKGLERSQAGRRLGGRAAKEALRYGQEYASGEYGKEFSRLSTLAGYGPASFDTGGPSGVPGTIEAGGRAQAAAGMAGSQAVSQAIQGGLQNYMTYQAYNQPPAPAQTWV